jgi:hypothetical protein
MVARKKALLLDCYVLALESRLVAWAYYATKHRHIMV